MELANSNYECMYTCPRDIKDRKVIDFLRTPLISEHHTVSAYFFSILGKTAPPPTPYLRPCPVPGYIANPLHTVVFENAVNYMATSYSLAQSPLFRTLSIT